MIGRGKMLKKVGLAQLAANPCWQKYIFVRMLVITFPSGYVIYIKLLMLFFLTLLVHRINFLAGIRQ